MNILVVSQYFWPESFRINELVSSIYNLGHKVQVLTGKPNYPEGKIYRGYRSLGFSKELYKNVIIHRVPIFPRGIKNPYKLTLNYLSFIATATFYGLSSLLKKNFDIIFVYMPSPFIQAIPAIILGRIMKVPVVLYVQDLWPESIRDTKYISNESFLKLIEYVVKLIYKQSSLILVSSRPFIKAIKKYSPTAQIKYFPNSVDSIFLNSDLSSKPVINELSDGFKIIFAGNLGMSQAVHVLIELAERLQNYENIKIIVFGGGSELNWLIEQKKIKKLTNFSLQGRYPIELMPWILSQADALLLTLADKPTYAATVPNRLQAYMAVGKPILACMNGESATLINEANCGFAVPAENSDELFKASIKMYNLKLQEREQLGRNGKLYFKKNFYHEDLVKTLINYFMELKSTKK